MEINDLDDVFFSKLRLSIISSLVTRKMFFSELKESTGATDGNLSVQLKNLVGWGYVTSQKTIYKNKFVTQYSLTEKGFADFEAYVRLLENIIDENMEK